MRSECFNTQPPEGGWLYGRDGAVRLILVSTHSRPKAAGYIAQQEFVEFSSFNTQPPEGGWLIKKVVQAEEKQFQHTAARRRLGRLGLFEVLPSCFNTQPPEGGWTVTISSL